MLALEDVVFLLGHFYEHEGEILKSKESLDELMVNIAVIEQKKAGKQKECAIF
jgi:hypothetical protein